AALRGVGLRSPNPHAESELRSIRWGPLTIARLREQKITDKLVPVLGSRWHEVISALHGVIEILKPIVTTPGDSNHALLNGLVLAQVRLVADKQQARLEERPEGIRATIDLHLASGQFHVALLLVA